MLGYGKKGRCISFSCPTTVHARRIHTVHTRCIIITQGQNRVRCDLSGYLWCSLRESSRIRSEIVAEGWINTTPHAQTYAIMKTKRRSCYNMMDRGATFHSTDRPSPSITSTTGEVEKAIKAWRVLASNPLQTLQTLETYCVRFNFHGVKLLQFLRFSSHPRKLNYVRV